MLAVMSEKVMVEQFLLTMVDLGCGHYRREIRGALRCLYSRSDTDPIDLNVFVGAFLRYRSISYPKARLYCILWEVWDWSVREVGL